VGVCGFVGVFDRVVVFDLVGVFYFEGVVDLVGVFGAVVAYLVGVFDPVVASDLEEAYPVVAHLVEAYLVVASDLEETYPVDLLELASDPVVGFAAEEIVLAVGEIDLVVPDRIDHLVEEETDLGIDPVVASDLEEAYPVEEIVPAEEEIVPAVGSILVVAFGLETASDPVVAFGLEVQLSQEQFHREQ